MAGATVSIVGGFFCTEKLIHVPPFTVKGGLSMLVFLDGFTTQKTQTPIVVLNIYRITVYAIINPIKER
jgi:hypothetical protein